MESSLQRQRSKKKRKSWKNSKPKNGGAYVPVFLVFPNSSNSNGDSYDDNFILPNDHESEESDSSKAA